MVCGNTESQLYRQVLLMDSGHTQASASLQLTWQHGLELGTDRTVNRPSGGLWSVSPTCSGAMSYSYCISHHLSGQSSAPGLWVLRKWPLLSFSACPDSKGWVGMKGSIYGHKLLKVGRPKILAQLFMAEKAWAKWGTSLSFLICKTGLEFLPHRDVRIKQRNI